MAHWCNDYDDGKTEICGQDPIPVPHFPLQISHWLARTRTLVSAAEAGEN